MPNLNSPGLISGRVLVLGSDTRSFLSVVRSLGRAGLRVDSAWTAPNSLPLARRSRYIQRVHDDLPRYSPMNRKWLDACLRRVAEMQYDLVIPTSDPVILPLQEHRRELDPRQFYLLEEEAFKVTNDKAKTYELAALLGISVPSQRIVATENEAEEAADLFGYPLILKPNSVFHARRWRRQAIRPAGGRRRGAPPIAAGHAARRRCLRAVVFPR